MMNLRRSMAALLLALGLLFAAPVLAQDAEGSTDAAYGASEGESLSESGFQAASGTRAGDEVPGGLLMLAAYGVAAGLLMTYVIVLVRRQRAVGDELDQLRRRMGELDDRLEDLETSARS